MSVPVLSGSVWLPRAMERPKVTKDLTVGVYSLGDETVTNVKLYRRGDGGIYVPRQYGLAYLRSIGSRSLVDNTSKGHAVVFPKTIKLYPEQEPFVDKLESLWGTQYDTIAKADVGKGKTVMALEAIRRMGRTAMVVVDQEFLKQQWKDRAMEFLGLREEDIGQVQGGVCDYEGKKLVIGMIQSLYAKDHIEDMYRYFGVVVFDEVHTTGAEQFSRTLMKFPAHVRFGVSATPDRTDAMQKAISCNLGNVCIVLEQSHRKSHVRYVEYGGVLSFYANVSPKSGRFVNELVADTYRNDLLSDILVWMYRQGRDVLAVSDRIEHLGTLRALCRIKGVPDDEMGLIAGYDPVWMYAKDATPSSRPEGLEPGAEYTPVCLQLVRKRVPKRILEDRKNTKRMLFATYGMFTKGVDVPRLSAGLDCTPRSKAKQVHGRILRPSEGKMTPLWVTIRDIMSYKAEYQFSNRLTEYIDSNVEIFQWHLVKGIKKTEVAELRGRVSRRVRKLKQCRILTKRDGNSIVVMP